MTWSRGIFLLPLLGVGSLVIVMAYAAVLRGDVRLRRWFLLHLGVLLPISVCLAIIPSISDARVALNVYQFLVAMVPLVGIGGIHYRLALLPPSRDVVWRGRLVVVGGLLLAGWTLLSPAVVVGVQLVDYGWFFVPGAHAWLFVGLVLANSALGAVPLVRVAVASEPSPLRQQLRWTLVANLITAAALIDIRIAYGFGAFRSSWILLALGSALSLRALMVHDLLRARAVDTRVPRTISSLVLTTLFGWMVLRLLGPSRVAWADALALVGAYCAIRTVLTIFDLMQRGGAGRTGPLTRLLQHFAERAFALPSPTAIAALGQEVASLGFGVAVEIWLASPDDWGWRDQYGQRIADQAALDPMFSNWLVEHEHASGVIDASTVVPEDFRAAHANLLHNTRAVVLMIRGGNLYGLARIPKSVKRSETLLTFAVQWANHMGDALLFHYLQRDVAAQVTLARDVELTASIQASLLPTASSHFLQSVEVMGAWQPASACGGDFWTVKALGRRTLLVVADVSGHGIAPAMVTAAVAGACAAMAGVHAATLDVATLVAELDVVVRRAGGGQLHMTCFAAIIDGTEIEYINAGHTAPYVAAVRGQSRELSALVGRGNPLGLGAAGAWKVQRRDIAPGALLVAFTDGLTDAQTAAGESYGDRRLQKLLRTLPATATPAEALRIVRAAVDSHRAGMPLPDDQMVVVARIREAPAVTV